MLHGRRLHPSSRVIGGGAAGSALGGSGSRSRSRSRSQAPLPARQRRPGQRSGIAAPGAPASGHLNPTPAWRADATPGRGGGGDRGANGEPGTGPEGAPGVFPRGSPAASWGTRGRPAAQLRAEPRGFPG